MIGSLRAEENTEDFMENLYENKTDVLSVTSSYILAWLFFFGMNEEVLDFQSLKHLLPVLNASLKLNWKGAESRHLKLKCAQLNSDKKESDPAFDTHFLLTSLFRFFFLKKWPTIYDKM